MTSPGLGSGSGDFIFFGSDFYVVVMSIEAYERLITDTQIDAAIAEAESEAEGGAVLMNAKEALIGLRRKYAK